MRIVIDMQGAQSIGHRDRGIGRYSMALAKAMARNRGEHEIILALNGSFPETIKPIRQEFTELLPQDNIRVWEAPGPISGLNADNDARRRRAEIVREAFLASLAPDVVHVTSLFEGAVDDAATSVGLHGVQPLTVVTLYDLIPYVYRKPYLERPPIKRWYMDKIEHLRKADLCLAISESSRREAVEHIHLPENRCVTISTDADPQFRPVAIPIEDEQYLRKRYGLDRPFVMYCGGIERRKNVERLIESFAKLPEDVRNSYQLAVVCSVQLEDRRRLTTLAKKCGLGDGDLILTGFVQEDELLAFYNLCALFIFPSWHEGFGLPVLEAMRCGAVAIGANVSSVPEVIGLEEALFDPHSAGDTARILERGLTDMTFRERFLNHAREHIRTFSWNKSAKLALTAMEQLVNARCTNIQRPNNAPGVPKRPRLAYCSPLPPERSGIADYSAELLPALSKYYEIDVIVGGKAKNEFWVPRNCNVVSIDNFRINHGSYERIVYHFGNSEFHQHMFEMLKVAPGVVVLHDFYLSGIIAHMDIHGGCSGVLARTLYNSHGYRAMLEYVEGADVAEVVWKYPANLSVIQDSLGMIVHSEHSVQLMRRWYMDAAHKCAIVPHLRDARKWESRSVAREALGIAASDFLVCSFGMIGPTKLNNRLLSAWLKSPLAQRRDCHLVFVGENHTGQYGDELIATVRKARTKTKILITGWAEPERFRQYLAAADIAVQLRMHSRGETSGTVLDCMNQGLATIVNANGSMADLNENAVWKLPDEFTDEQLTAALIDLWRNPDRRRQIGDAGRSIIRKLHHPNKCAAQYHEAIEGFYNRAEAGWRSLPKAIAKCDTTAPSRAEIIDLATSIAKAFPSEPRQKQILVDISELAQHDVGTGIQRVARALLKELLQNPPQGYRVEPVYANVAESYRYARRFTAKFLGIPQELLSDEGVEFGLGDIFFGLDLNPNIQFAQREFYRELRDYGVRVVFMVYDLLCVRMPNHFVSGSYELLSNWLKVISTTDGAICISNHVAHDLVDWIKENAPDREEHFTIDWVHLGADIEKSRPTVGMPEEAAQIIARLRRRPTFLMVGTIEPRKGHAQALAAFERLWEEEVEVNLAIVGKQGWCTEALVKKLRAHPRLGTSLFWLEQTSDEYLEKVYGAATCLLAASEGEGFGLPLIEAARHRLPILARDLPVFQEVAGGHANYFSGCAPEDLANAVKQWLLLHEKGQHSRSDDMPWITWAESARRIVTKILPPSMQIAGQDN